MRVQILITGSDMDKTDQIILHVTSFMLNQTEPGCSDTLNEFLFKYTFHVQVLWLNYGLNMNYDLQDTTCHFTWKNIWTTKDPTELLHPSHLFNIMSDLHPELFLHWVLAHAQALSVNTHDLY